MMNKKPRMTKTYTILCIKIMKTKRKKGTKISVIQIIHVFQVLAGTITGEETKKNIIFVILSIRTISPIYV